MIEIKDFYENFYLENIIKKKCCKYNFCLIKYLSNSLLYSRLNRVKEIYFDAKIDKDIEINN